MLAPLATTSPVLFEKEVLKTVEWKQRLNVDDFASFADLLVQVSFQKVLNQRLSKVQQFWHPDFRKGGINLQAMVMERAELRRERKMSQEQKSEFSVANLSEKVKREAADPAQRVNWQRKKTFDDDSADSTRTAKRRKGEEKATHGKRRKIAILNFPVVLSSGVPPANKCAESTGQKK